MDGFSQRGKLMKPEYAKDIKTRDQWQKSLYRIRMNVKKAKADDPLYKNYVRAIDNLIQSRKEEKKPPRQKTPSKPFEKSQIPILSPAPRKTTLQQPSEEEEVFQDASAATGSGLGSGLITQCPNNILADVERLEILIGGKGAGNNSSEIINEAADICKRLFTGGIMDINVYQSLIGEIADDYYSD